jgi:hypothetical protein
MSNRNDKFRDYWVSLGAPSLESKHVGAQEFGKCRAPIWQQDCDYRLAGDMHWELRKAWVDSDFTLPIEVFIKEDEYGEDRWVRCQSTPSWDNKDCFFRAAKGPVPANPEEVQEDGLALGADIASTLAERGSRYGVFKGHARITQGIKRVMHSEPGWEKLTDDKKECLDMLAHKIGRILNGDPEYKDSWHDIVGYSKLVDDTLES